MNFAHSLHMLFVIGKYVDVFFWEEFCPWDGFPLEESSLRRNISRRGEFSKKTGGI